MNMPDHETEFNVSGIERAQSSAKRRERASGIPTFAFENLIATGAQPASSTAPESPVQLLAREWQAYSAWVNGPETNATTEEEFDRLTDKLNHLVARVLAAPSLSDRDTAIKYYVLVMEYQPYSWLEGLDALLAESKGLISGTGRVAPEAPHAGDYGAVSGNDDTPILQLYRRYTELMDAADAYKPGDMTVTDEEMDKLFHDERYAIEVKMTAMPCQTAGDFAAKAIICTSRGRVFPDWETGDVWVEARKLVGDVDAQQLGD